MKKQSFLQSLLVLGMTLSIFSCKKEISGSPSKDGAIPTMATGTNRVKENTFFGPAVSLGNGTMRSFYSINPSGKPKELGVEISAAAIASLPAATDVDPAYRFVLPLPAEAFEATPYQHIYLDWNPHGHEPDPIYGVPHFDFHFYTIPSAERQTIPLYTNETASLFDNFPASTYLPAGYVPIPGGAPQMGKHWIDPASPEFNGHPFTYTLIYGTYSGKVIFVEPMITLSTLLGGTNYKLNLPQPEMYAPAGTYYPKEYSISFNSDTQKYYVSLTNFKQQ